MAPRRVRRVHEKDDSSEPLGVRTTGSTAAPRDGAAAQPGVREILPEWETEIFLLFAHLDLRSARVPICPKGLLHQSNLFQSNGFSAPVADDHAAPASARGQVCVQLRLTQS